MCIIQGDQEVESLHMGAFKAALVFLRAFVMARSSLAVENLVLRQQLQGQTR